MSDDANSEDRHGQDWDIQNDHAREEEAPMSRSERVAFLRRQLREAELAFIAEELVLLGHKNPKRLTAYYRLDADTQLPVLESVYVEYVLEPAFMGTDGADALNSLLLVDYDPDMGDYQIEYELPAVPTDEQAG